jgi:hypothetical protein
MLSFSVWCDFFLFRSVDVEDSGLLGCYTDCYIGF